MIKGVWSNAYLLRQLVRRDIESKHKGTFGGRLWLLGQPLLMLAIYTLVFGLIFQPKWVGLPSIWDFSLILFLGKIPYIYVLETVGRAPALLLANGSYVKKTQFPLGLLVLMAQSTALVVVLISLVAWIVFFVIINAGPPPLALLIVPVLYLPLCLFVTGLCYFLTSLGAYFRDVGQIVQPILFSMMFLSPVFYPIDQSPGWMRGFLLANPMSQTIEQSRGVLYFSQGVDWSWWGAHLVGGLVVLALGHAWFRRTRGGFAEVI